MTMAPLHMLAAAAGIARLWTDADGVEQQVSDDSLRAILAALGLPANSPAEIMDSWRRLMERAMRAPQLLTVDCNAPVPLPDGFGSGILLNEAGAVMERDASRIGSEGIAEPGYYQLVAGDAACTIAVAPERCRQLKGRCWGVAVQIPSLRGSGDFGDFADLARAVTLLGKSGANAVALSPTHALSIDDPGRFAPYSPSSRIALNALLGEAETTAAATTDPLIDWTQAGPAKLEALRQQFDGTEDFATFLQQNARTGLDQVQQAARDAGMAVGLIADLAVGVDPAGMEAQDDPDLFLNALSIGAPPDPLGPLGQDWGLTSYSPFGLADSGFAPFIAMLRANIPAGGGIRIDHAFGLQRLWVVPRGRSAHEGAYIAYPFDDLVRLVKLEAWRANAIVIAEDLGTRPPGFVDALEAAGIYEMAVLPFSRDEEGAFLPAEDYRETAVAMSATHDIATLAGWWTGRDLEWNRKLDRGGQTAEERADDRKKLWAVIGGALPQPADDDPAPVVDRAIAFLTQTPCPLLIVPMEDLAALVEQPNLPGTVDEHPNWRRRLPAPMAELLCREDVARRIALLNAERGA
jgi:4-alpha-glucanotransferase